MKSVLFTVVGCLAAGCSASPRTEASAPAAAPIAPAVQREPSEAERRADALVADMERRSREHAKQERENPYREKSAAVLLQEVQSANASRPASAPLPSPATPIQFQPTAGSPSTLDTGGRDEAWWKNEMRNAEVRLDDNTRRWQEAREVETGALNQMRAATKAGAIVFAQAQEAFNLARADVQRLEAEVRNDRAAVERIREDARRANVPPGWLRWP